MRDMSAMRMPSCEPIRPASVIMAKTVIQSPVDPITAAQKKRAKSPEVIRERVVRGADSSETIALNPSSIQGQAIVLAEAGIA